MGKLREFGPRDGRLPVALDREGGPAPGYYRLWRIGEGTGEEKTYARSEARAEA